MNIIAVVMAIVLGGLQLGDASDDITAHEVNGNGQICITAERIIKPTHNWRILKTEIKYENKLPFLEVSVHNPLNNKAPTSVDARFILSIDPASPSDVQKYNLVAATYYNAKATVSFKRIYSVHEVMVKNKAQKFPMQTPCFDRQVMQIIQFEPAEIKVQGSTPDGGVK